MAARRKTTTKKATAPRPAAKKPAAPKARTLADAAKSADDIARGGRSLGPPESAIKSVMREAVTLVRGYPSSERHLATVFASVNTRLRDRPGTERAGAKTIATAIRDCLAAGLK